MFSFSKSLMASALAWMVAVAVVMLYAWMGKPENYRGVPNLLEFSRALGLLGMAMAVVVFPTCMLVATPLLALLPKSSVLWRPGWAFVTGVLMGPLAMYVWASIYKYGNFIPDAGNPTHSMLGVASAAAGGTFGFCYSRSLARG